jgi:tetratricopeptide (TPR) repeat protein
MRYGLLLSLLLPLSLTAGVRAVRAAEPEPDASPARSLDAEVDRHATRGQRLLDRGQTQEAIAEFRRAYELRADARFLYDIAECYRQLGLVEQALHFYQRYLSVAPDAADRDEVEVQIEALEKQRPALAKPAPSLANDVVLIPVAPGQAPEHRPIWKRWWAWAALGALVVGGATLALTLGRDDTNVPQTALGDKTFY